jgi:3-methyladenine DNA glycosylase AlkC
LKEEPDPFEGVWGPLERRVGPLRRGVGTSCKRSWTPSKGCGDLLKEEPDPFEGVWGPLERRVGPFVPFVPSFSRTIALLHSRPMITKISDVPHLVTNGRLNPATVFPKIRSLAASASWQEREVAATALVEISKKQGEAVLAELREWAKEQDSNLRRAASEGLRHLARHTPDSVVPVLELLRSDEDLYVRKSVANILRNAGKNHPEFVLALCRRWALVRDKHTDWIVREGLRKLRETKPEQVDQILGLLGQP